MVPLDSSLAALSEAADRLNAETDELNDLIRSLDEQLAEMRIGITVWDGRLLHGVVSAEPSPDREGYCVGWVLGYTKLEDTWCLATKQVGMTSFIDNDGEFEESEEVILGPLELSQAPRLVRVEAAGRFEILVDNLARRIKGFVSDIERAKGLVQSKDEMTIDELKDAKETMGEYEHLQRHRECLDRGGCKSTLATASNIQQYCTHCLTLWANGYAQDAPPMESLLRSES